MKHFKSFLSVISLATLSLTAAAKADTLQFTGATVASGPDYIYPYQFSVNNSAASTSLMCVDFDREIYVGESWTATASTVTAASSTLLQEEAFLFNQDLTNPGSYSGSDYQYAVWALGDLSGVQASGMDSSNVQALDALAIAAVSQGTDAAAYLDGQYTAYTAVNGSQPAGDGLPQDFLGVSPVPEPGSLALLGTGVLGLAGVVRRKLARS
jgi:PEP-CTERM motif